MNRNIIVMAKNPLLGKVKTRLANSIGSEAALAVYLQLLNYTINLLKNRTEKIHFFFSEEIPANFQSSNFNTYVQTHGNLGEKMKHAFASVMKAGAEKTIIVGSDCAMLKTDHLDAAFNALQSHDIVIGPATDGGYYLIGMHKQHDYLFENMPWSQPNLLKQSIEKIKRNHNTFFLLESLSDLDTEADWKAQQSLLPPL